MSLRELEEMAAALRALGSSDCGARIAAKAAPLLQSALEVTLTAGESPSGQAWAERKAGGRAYTHAGARIAAKSAGDLVYVTLTGPEVYGHFGARGMPVRQMLPDAGATLPASVTKPLNDAASAVFEEVTK